jgi:uncharacterized protein
MTSGVQILVLAKAPLPGRAKTRLSPPLTLAEAAQLARAALKDTLAAVMGVRAERRVLVLDGPPPALSLEGFEVIAQRGVGLAERIAAAFEDAGAPALLIGMDTPQVTAELLEHSCLVLMDPSVDAVIGPTEDGGYWGIGMKELRLDVFTNVPMSTSATLRAQRERLASEGLRVGSLPRLRDVDEFDDAWAVAAEKPGSDFAYSLAEVTARIGVRA